MLTYAELSRREGTPISRSPDFSQQTGALNVLDLVNLTPLMELTSGTPEIVIGLVDGPVVIGHPDLAGESVREIPGRIGGTKVAIACPNRPPVGVPCRRPRRSYSPSAGQL